MAFGNAKLWSIINNTDVYFNTDVKFKTVNMLYTSVS